MVGGEGEKIAPFFLLFFWSHFCFPASGQAVVSGVVPSPPRYVPSIFIAHRVQHHSHCSSIFIECFKSLQLWNEKQRPLGLHTYDRTILTFPPAQERCLANSSTHESRTPADSLLTHQPKTKHNPDLEAYNPNPHSPERLCSLIPLEG